MYKNATLKGCLIHGRGAGVQRSGASTIEGHFACARCMLQWGRRMRGTDMHSEWWLPIHWLHRVTDE